MAPKLKRRNKSKAEIEQELKRITRTKVLRAFVKDKFYPHLIKASNSIDDAKFLTSSLGNMVMEQFLGLMKDMKFSELKLIEKLDPKADKHEEYKAMIELFNDESVYDTRELIEGMKNEIQMNIDNELKERKLESLKTNFLE